jgi:hypothetical protein
MEEEDEFFDFKFNDDAHTQPYLSLGLTPLSQLSPADPGPPSGSGDSNYFFPSMPPPVTPISSVFSTPGIPVDSPFQLDTPMVMPEANPVGTVESTASAARRTGRRGKHETSTPQAYALKLEPVPEQSCSLDDGFGTILNHNAESSSSSAEDSSYLLLSPSDAGDSKVPPHLRRKTGKRRKSGTRRRMENDWGDDEGTVMWNKSLRDVVGDYPVKLSREESPRQEGRRLRQEIREQELAKQKEELRQKHLEAEKARLMHQEQRAAQIAHDYGSTRQREVNIDQAISPNLSGGRLVLQQAMRFEAQAQLMQDLNLSASSPGQTSDSNYIVRTSNQFSVL